MEIKFKKRKTVLKLTSQEFEIIIQALKMQDETYTLKKDNDEEVQRNILDTIEWRMKD